MHAFMSICLKIYYNDSKEIKIGKSRSDKENERKISNPGKKFQQNLGLIGG